MSHISRSGPVRMVMHVCVYMVNEYDSTVPITGLTKTNHQRLQAEATPHLVVLEEGVLDRDLRLVGVGVQRAALAADGGRGRSGADRVVTA